MTDIFYFLNNNFKYVFLVYCVLIFNAFSYSQVGINTSSPLGVLHIDPLKNTSTTSGSMLDDTVVR